MGLRDAACVTQAQPQVLVVSTQGIYLFLPLIWGSPVPHCSQTQGFGGEGGLSYGWQL